VLRAALAAYLGRYRRESRVHTGSDLKVFLTWCAGQDLDPLNLGRVEVERYVAGDSLLSAVDGVPAVVGCRRFLSGVRHRSDLGPLASRLRTPTTDADPLTDTRARHLQFEALLTTVRLSANRNDFALIAMLGRLRVADLRSLRREPRRPR
jgi:integrase/recombinase XerD